MWKMMQFTHQFRNKHVIIPWFMRQPSRDTSPTAPAKTAVKKKRKRSTDPGSALLRPDSLKPILYSLFLKTTRYWLLIWKMCAEVKRRQILPFKELFCPRSPSRRNHNCLHWEGKAGSGFGGGIFRPHLSLSPSLSQTHTHTCVTKRKDSVSSPARDPYF